MFEEIVCAGFGGQGIMLMGKLLAHLGLRAGYYVSWMPSYGAEVRGGTAHSMVTISAQPIASPLIFKPKVALIMNGPSLDKFESKIKKKGLAIINTSMISRHPKRKDIRLFELPATEIAEQLGNAKVQNMVMLGAYLQVSGTFSLKQANVSLKESLPKHRRGLLKLNQDALKKGAEVVGLPG